MAPIDMKQEQTIPLSTDWLALSLHLLSPVGDAPAGHVWAKYSPTNVWGCRWCLFNEFGDKVFTLLFAPRSAGFLKQSCALLEVANEWLYHGIGEKGVLDLLSATCRFTIQGISRLDLAADFSPSSRQASIIRGLADGRYYVGGKRNGSGFWSMVKDDNLDNMWQGRVPHCQSWGHKTSDVRWKLYYKTKELRDALGGFGYDKPYIVDMWRSVGLDERNVWRLEVSIHNCNSFEFMGKKLTYDAYRASGSDLFQALYTSRFDVRKNEGHKDKSNDTQVPLLNVGRLSNAFQVRIRDTIAEHNGRLSLLRHIVNDLKTEQVLLSETARETMLQSVVDIVEHDGLEPYFREVTGMTLADWVEWSRVQAYYFGSEFDGHKKPQQSNALYQAMLDAQIINNPDEVEKSLSAPNPKCLNQLNLFNHET